MTSIFERAIVVWLEDYMKREQIRPSELARRLDWSPSDLGNTLKERRGIGGKRQRHIAEKLSIPFDAFIEQVVSIQANLTAGFKCPENPIASAMAADNDAQWAPLTTKTLAPPDGVAEELTFINVFSLQLAMTPGDKGLQKLVESLSLPARFSRLAPIGLRIDSNEMTPTILSGAVIGLDYRSTSISEGLVYVGRIPGKGAVVRRIFTGSNQTVILSADNKRFPDIILQKTEIEEKRLIVGQVKWVIQAV